MPSTAQKLKKNHKTLISATQRTSENIDGTKNLDGILLENVYIGLAEYYSLNGFMDIISQSKKKENISPPFYICNFTEKNILFLFCV